jgi:hypothetical protein
MIIAMLNKSRNHDTLEMVSGHCNKGMLLVSCFLETAVIGIDVKDCVRIYDCSTD